MSMWISIGQLILAVLGVLLLGWECWLLRRGHPEPTRRFRDRALAVLGVLGAAAYLNFGRLHSDGLIHIWDTYHYYIGAKYFPELRYERLYECTAVADAEAGLRHEVATRAMTDLRSNQGVTTSEILIHPETCLDQFSAERWAAFQRDVAWFRQRVDRATWHRIQRDHGYNATPVWHMLGHGLSNLTAASELQIGALLLLDPLLLVGAFGLLAWGFGWRVCAIAALMMGTFSPSRFDWTGGSFLRFDWLCCAIGGVCALRKDRPFLGGMALGYAALLRLFPVALLVGPALAAIDHRWRTRRWHPAHVRLFSGVAVVVTLALPPALGLSGDGGTSFVANTRKHADTPLTNYMGLPTLLAYRPTSTVRELRKRDRFELWPRFQQARRHAAAQTRPALLVAGLLALGLIAQAARRELWRAAAVSLLLVPVLLQLTCYYYVCVILWATLAEQRPGIGAGLLGMCAASIALMLGLFPRVGMDEGYVALSLLMMLSLGATAWRATCVRTAAE